MADAKKFKKAQKLVDDKYLQDLDAELYEKIQRHQVALRNKKRSRGKERHNDPRHKMLKNEALKLINKDLATKIKQASLFLAILGLGVFGGYKATKTVDSPKYVNGVHETMDTNYMFVSYVVLPALFVLWAASFYTLSATGTPSNPNPYRKEFMNAARKILAIKGLKKGYVEQFMQAVESDEKFQKKAYKILQKFSKDDGSYIERLWQGGLKEANFATAIAIIAGHLESYPNDYYIVIDAMQDGSLPNSLQKEEDLPEAIRAAYGNTIMYVASGADKNIRR